MDVEQEDGGLDMCGLSDSLRTPDCPAPETFLADEFGSLSELERARIERHVAVCAVCRVEQLLAAAYDEAGDAGIRASLERVTERVEAALDEKERWHQRAGRRWLPPAFAAAAAVVGLTMALMFFGDGFGPSLPPADDGATVFRGASIPLLSPQGDLDRAPDEYRWAAIVDAAAYRINITNVAGETVATGKVDSAVWQPTHEQRAAQSGGVRYRWQVEALDASGDVIARSGQGEYRLAPD